MTVRKRRESFPPLSAKQEQSAQEQRQRPRSNQRKPRDEATAGLNLGSSALKALSQLSQLQFLRTRPAIRPLLSIDQIPEWHRDNPYISHGYRPISLSTSHCFYSLFYMHNETLNIYTHLIPGVCFLYIQFVISSYISHHYPDATLGDHIVFFWFCTAAFITLSMSALYHTIVNHSERISSVSLRLDYAAILFLTMGHFVSGIYVGFYCNPVLQKVYWTMILTLATTTGVLVIHPAYQGPPYRTTRLRLFIATAVSGFLPIIHGLILYGWSHMYLASGMPFYLLEGLIFIIGVMFYATRFPESLGTRFPQSMGTGDPEPIGNRGRWKGRFDLVGASHQIWHLCVVLAMGVHLWGIWGAWRWRVERGGGCAWDGGGRIG